MSEKILQRVADQMLQVTIETAKYTKRIIPISLGIATKEGDDELVIFNITDISTFLEHLDGTTRLKKKLDEMWQQSVKSGRATKLHGIILLADSELVDVNNNNHKMFAVVMTVNKADGTDCYIHPYDISDEGLVFREDKRELVQASGPMAGLFPESAK